MLIDFGFFPDSFIDLVISLFSDFVVDIIIDSDLFY